MARYKPVTRVITIFIHEDPHGIHHVDVTPDPAEAIQGDAIRWEVQNAPRGVHVGVGNVTLVDPPPGVRVSGQKRTLRKPRTITVARQKRPGVNITIPTKSAETGYYKYDILFDAMTVLDPDIEIKEKPG